MGIIDVRHSRVAPLVLRIASFLRDPRKRVRRSLVRADESHQAACDQFFHRRYLDLRPDLRARSDFRQYYPGYSTDRCAYAASAQTRTSLCYLDDHLLSVIVGGLPDGSR